jgi:hypothetical protein
VIADPTYADAILDHLVSNAHSIGIAAGIPPRLRLLYKLALDTLPGLLGYDCSVQADVGPPFIDRPSYADRFESMW